MARTRKTRPAYERWGVTRDRVEADYGRFYKEGGATNGIREGEEFRKVLADCGFSLEPRSSWDRIAYEVRLIGFGMDGLWPEEKGNAESGRDCRRLARKIDTIAHSVGDLTQCQAVSVAEMFTKTDFADYISEFFMTARRLEMLAEYLENSKQPTKWATTRKREARLVLACKLAPLFEQEFGVHAKPRGGSEAYQDLRDENDWTKFFQCMAMQVLDEERTKDRQEILWEADKLSEIPDG